MASAHSRVVFTMQGVDKVFGDLKAFDAVSLQVYFNSLYLWLGRYSSRRCFHSASTGQSVCLHAENVIFGIGYWYAGAYPQGQRTSGDGISSPGDLHNFGTGIPSANLSGVGFFPLARVPYAKR